MSTRRGRALARVLVLVTLLGAGVAGYAPSTASAAPGVDTGWQHEADRTVDLVRGLGGLDGLARSTAVEVRDLRRSVDDLIGRAPRAELRTERDDALVRWLGTAHAFEALVDVVDVSRVSFASDAAEVATASTVDQRVRPG